MCITTYEALKLVPELRRKKNGYNWHYVVFDEAHKLKNADSLVANISRDLNCKHRLLLTGTPLMNNISELWSLLNFLMPELFDSVDAFDEMFNFDSNEKNAEMNQD